MASNALQFTVTPWIPNDLLCGLEGHLLMTSLGHDADEGDTTYFFCEDGLMDEIEIDDDLCAFMDHATGPIADKIRQHIDVQSQVGETFTFYDIDTDYTDILHALVAANPDRLPLIEVQGCWTCSKMRPGEFGGFAALITPSGIESIDTAQWLMKNRPRKAAA